MDSCSFKDQSNGRSRTFCQVKKYFYSTSEVHKMFVYIGVKEMEV